MTEKGQACKQCSLSETGRAAAGAQIITRDSPWINASRAKHALTTCFGIRNVHLRYNSRISILAGTVLGLILARQSRVE